MRTRTVNRNTFVVRVCFVPGWRRLSARWTHGTAMTNEKTVQPQEQATRAAIDRFNQAFYRHDTDAAAALLTDDTVFEDTSPAPDGRRIEGKVSWQSSGANGSHAILTPSLRRRRSSSAAMGPWSGEFIARSATGSCGTCGASTFLQCAMERSPRNSRM